MSRAKNTKRIEEINTIGLDYQDIYNSINLKGANKKENNHSKEIKSKSIKNKRNLHQKVILLDFY